MDKKEYQTEISNNHDKNNNMPEEKCRTKRILHKLSRMAKQTKFFFQAHFPKRIWAKPQENRKGPKI